VERHLHADSGSGQGQPIADVQTLLSLLTGYMHLYYVFVLLQFLVLYTLLCNHVNARTLLVCLILAALSSIAFYAFRAPCSGRWVPTNTSLEWRWANCSSGGRSSSSGPVARLHT